VNTKQNWLFWGIPFSASCSCFTACACDWDIKYYIYSALVLSFCCAHSSCIWCCMIYWVLHFLIWHVFVLLPCRWYWIFQGVLYLSHVNCRRHLESRSVIKI
jgi:hypothetical protein